MINLNIKSIEQCDEYIVHLLGFLDKVYNQLSKNENVELTKTFVKDFGEKFEMLIKFIHDNKFLNEKIFSDENDLKFALESFGEAFHSLDYDLCAEILKYEIKYILCKWKVKLELKTF